MRKRSSNAAGRPRCRSCHYSERLQGSEHAVLQDEKHRGIIERRQASESSVGNFDSEGGTGIPLKALLFDFDGVISETEQVWRNLFSRICNEFAIPFPKDLFDASLGGQNNSFNPFEYVASRTARLGIEVESQIRAEARNKLLASSPLPGVVHLVESARREGVLLGIVSNALFTEVLPYLEHWALSHLFQVVVTRSDGLPQKPDRAPYQRALELLQVGAAHVVAIEDSTPGIAAAQAAGLMCVGVHSMHAGSNSLDRADLVVESIADLAIADQKLRHAPGAHLRA